MAQGLCQRGYRVLSFRYAYMELARRAGKPRPPDRRAMLEHVHERALDTLLALEPQPRAILAGKSLGGRISTHLAAKGAIAHALVLLGYPLHPPHQPERCRSEHFPAIAQPALFLQGTRDEFCTLPLLQQALVTYGGRAQLCVLEGANHGFELTRKAGKSTRQLWDEVLERIVSFETSCFSD